MIGRQSGDQRPNDTRYPASVCRRFFDKMSSTDRLTIVSRLTPDDRTTFGPYHDLRNHCNIFWVDGGIHSKNGGKTASCAKHDA